MRRRLLTATGMTLLGVGLALTAALAVDRLVAAGVATSVAQLGVFTVGLVAVGAWYRRATAGRDAEPSPPAPGACVHGERPDPGRVLMQAKRRRLRAVVRHLATCGPGARLFWHWRGLRRRICCSTCGARVA